MKSIYAIGQIYAVDQTVNVNRFVTYSILMIHKCRMQQISLYDSEKNIRVNFVTDYQKIQEFPANSSKHWKHVKQSFILLVSCAEYQRKLSIPR